MQSESTSTVSKLAVESTKLYEPALGCPTALSHVGVTFVPPVTVQLEVFDAKSGFATTLAASAGVPAPMRTANATMAVRPSAINGA
jgi:hypothetical protein